METYAEFLKRVASFEQAELSIAETNFLPNSCVTEKVNSDNTFGAFYGDTVVFDLATEDKIWLAEIVKKLYDEAPGCFAEKLPVSSYHMTLHDLSSGSQFSELTGDLEQNRQRIEKRLDDKPLAHKTIKMTSHFIFNMCNTSLVMGLVPVSESDYKILRGLYQLVDDVRRLPYPFTPHITLAYYHVNGFSVNEVKKLKRIVAELNKNQRRFVLDTSRLYYQTFSSMEYYQTIFSLVKDKE